MRMKGSRLLFVHAHPDDETLTTGATIAHYAALGADVRVVTCTLGEEGEVIGERWARLAVDQADQLGGFRIGELSAALKALGLEEPTFLGGAARWRDSGMEGTPPRDRQRFIDADPREAVGALVGIIRELRPHVVVTYDVKGGYGHPDHIHVHEVTMAAVAASGGADYPGEPWTVPKVYWTAMSKSAMAAGLDALEDVPTEWIRVSIDDVPFGYPDDVDRRGYGRSRPAAREGRGAACSRDPGHHCPGRPVLRPVEQHGLADRGNRALHPCGGHTRRARRPRVGDRPAGRVEPGIAQRARGKLPDNRRRVEGMAMDPDMDPNLQHWQDRADSFQWVNRVTCRTARQHPDLTPLRPVVLALLAIDGVLSAVAAAFFLPLRIGSVPFPISALISGLVNAVLVWAALQWTSVPRVAALPLWCWLLTVAGLTFGGPGDDIVFGGAGIMEYAPLLLIVLGALPPALLLYRRTRSR